MTPAALRDNVQWGHLKIDWSLSANSWKPNTLFSIAYSFFCLQYYDQSARRMTQFSKLIRYWFSHALQVLETTAVRVESAKFPSSFHRLLFSSRTCAFVVVCWRSVSHLGSQQNEKQGIWRIISVEFLFGDWLIYYTFLWQNITSKFRNTGKCQVTRMSRVPRKFGK